MWRIGYMTIFRPFDKYPEVSECIGQMLAAYTVLELDLLHCVQMATGDFSDAFKAMFGLRGETRRINEAQKRGKPIYDQLGLGAEFAEGLMAMRFCLRIRNQYAHCMWWDDNTGKLAFANLENIATNPIIDVSDLGQLRPLYIDLVLAREQRDYFAYTDAQLGWINFEGRCKQGLLPSGNMMEKLSPLHQPRLYLS
jgi:hypothetical protein